MRAATVPSATITIATATRGKNVATPDSQAVTTGSPKVSVAAITAHTNTNQ